MVDWSRAIPGYGTLQVWRGSGTASGETDERGMVAATENLSYPVACIWNPTDSGVGHASVFIRAAEGAFPEDDTRSYASLFPGTDVDTGRSGARREHLKPGRMLTGEANSFREDCALESGKKAEGCYRLPDHMIPLGNLDQLRMQAAWNAIRDKPEMHYRLLRKNCATIAARIIRAGMEKKQLVTSPLLTHKAWWTPHDVLLLSRSCQSKDQKRRMGELIDALGI
ncbi:MAG TPA: hypothetical protein VM689_25315 [Aliidongia sp.]|nr:hypothetical protein [Aliidongia sp.]